VSRPGRSLPPGKTWYPLYRRLGGPQGLSGRVQKIWPAPGFDPRTVQPVASRYTDYATRPTNNGVLGAKYVLVPFPVNTNHTLNALGWNPGLDCGLPAELWGSSEHCHSALLSVPSLHNPSFRFGTLLPLFWHLSTSSLFHQITLGRTPLDEWSARRRDLIPEYTQHSQQTAIFPSSERPPGHSVLESSI